MAKTTKRTGKYGVNPKSKRTYKGKVYASTLEMNYRIHLDKLTKAVSPKFRVVKIEEQVVFPIVILSPTGVYFKVCDYILDFRVTYADGRVEHVGTKGIRTAIYNIKKKLMFAVHGIKIKEVYRGDF